jgi:hypothetical protein
LGLGDEVLKEFLTPWISLASTYGFLLGLGSSICQDFGPFRVGQLGSDWAPPSCNLSRKIWSFLKEAPRDSKMNFLQLYLGFQGFHLLESGGQGCSLG